MRCAACEWQRVGEKGPDSEDPQRGAGRTKTKGQRQLVFSEYLSRASLVAQSVNNLPAMQETWVLSLGLERSPREGNGNLLQYACLGNPMDRRAWWATVHVVTRVKN